MMVSSTTCCISLQIFCLNLWFTSSRSVLSRMCMCACQTKKLILTSNELLKLLETTTDWHTNAFAHFWKYCHGTKFGKFQNNFVHLECIPTSSGCRLQHLHISNVSIQNVQFVALHNAYRILSVVRLFISAIVYCQFVFEMNFWAFAIYYYSSIKLESLRVRNVDDIVVHDSVNSNICVLFVVYGMFFSSSTYLNWVAFSHEI